MGFVIMSTESINKRLQILQDLQDELNKAKSLYDESLENDQVYQEIQEESEKLRGEVAMKKQKLLSTQTYQDMAEQARRLREEIKEHREILSQELADYYKESGLLEIIDQEGNTKRIKFSAKLVNV